MNTAFLACIASSAAATSVDQFQFNNNARFIAPDPHSHDHDHEDVEEDIVEAKAKILKLQADLSTVGDKCDI